MKFLVFLMIVVSIWYVMRWIQQADAVRRMKRPPQPSANPFAAARQRSAPHATDTVLCARCGAYVPTDVTTACGRTDCPFPAMR